MSRKTLRNRGKERVAPPSYAFDDLGTQRKLLTGWHLSVEKTNAIAALLGKATRGLRDLALVLTRLTRRIAEHRGTSIRQKPHQGAQECARRIRQGVAA